MLLVRRRNSTSEPLHRRLSPSRRKRVCPFPGRGGCEVPTNTPSQSWSRCSRRSSFLTTHPGRDEEDQIVNSSYEEEGNEDEPNVPATRSAKLSRAQQANSADDRRHHELVLDRLSDAAVFLPERSSHGKFPGGSQELYCAKSPTQDPLFESSTRTQLVNRFCTNRWIRIVSSVPRLMAKVTAAPKPPNVKGGVNQ